MQGCEGFIFCKADETSHSVGLSLDFCMLLHSVQDVAGDRSPFPGRCTSGRACAASCQDLDSQLPLVFPDADSALTSSCSELVRQQPGNCWSSWNDGKAEHTSDPDVRLVQALCPESCRSCAGAASQGFMLDGRRSHAAVAAVELSYKTASVPQISPCSIEAGVLYDAGAEYLFKWRAVLSADICASFCASTVECLAFTFFMETTGSFSKFDCVLHNTTLAFTSGRRSDPCCRSGLACAARCTNQDLYVSLLMETGGLAYITNCEEYLVSTLFAQNASTCQNLSDPGLTQGLCPLSCYVRSQNSSPGGDSDVYPTSPPTLPPTTAATTSITSTQPLTEDTTDENGAGKLSAGEGMSPSSTTQPGKTQAALSSGHAWQPTSFVSIFLMMLI